MKVQSNPIINTAAASIIISSEEQANAFIKISDKLEELKSLSILNLKSDIKEVFVQFQGSKYCGEIEGEYRQGITERLLGLIDVLAELEEPLKQGHHDIIGDAALNYFVQRL